MRFYLIVFPLFLLLLIAHTAQSSKESRSNGTTTDSPVNSNNSTASSTSNKAAERVSYPKKVTSLKKRPTKTPTSFVTAAADAKTMTKKVADVTTAFKDLPADDLEFIKELDKQFQLHGDKIKIKVEHDNSTDAKNSKRTIEGELGYGHYHNGYEYQRPKFMFYPYSQQDISPNAPGYYPPEPSVSIEPSYSYELKPQTYVEQQQPQIDVPHGDGGAHADEGAQAPPQHYEEPVIVLRIPGPTKYASHLQTLLQQYLEIRATQYLRILEDHELHKQQELPQHGAALQAELQQQQHQQHQQQHYEQQLLDLQPPAAGHEQHVPAATPLEDQNYPQEVLYAHQMASTPQPVQYPEIDDVYHGYKGRHQHGPLLQQQQQPQQHFYIPPAQQHEAPQHAEQQHAEAPQLYFMPEQQYAHGPADHNYQNVYFVAMAPQVIYEEPEQQQHHQLQQQQQQLMHQSEQPLQQQPIYVQEEEGAAAAAVAVADHHHNAHEHSLPLSENSPRKTHTKVIFTHNSEQGAADYSNMYPLPSIRPFERHAATPAPAYQPLHQHQQQQHQQQAQLYAPPEEQAGNNLNYEPHVLPGAESQHQDTVAITQRPFNYHAHALKARGRQRNRKRGAAPSTDAADQTDTHFEQIRDYVRDKLGAKMSASVEFKTTEVVKG